MDHCWTSASDNGNAPPAACNPPAGTSSTGSTAGLGLPAGLSVDPTDAALVTGMGIVDPNVPPAAWLLYPNVIY